LPRMPRNPDEQVVPSRPPTCWSGNVPVFTALTRSRNVASECSRVLGGRGVLAVSWGFQEKIMPGDGVRFRRKPVSGDAIWRGCGLLLGLGVLAISPVIAPAQTVDEVIAKNIQAHGGMEKIKAVNTLRNSAKLSFGSYRAQATQ
jgi:hypothetical protein